MVTFGEVTKTAAVEAAFEVKRFQSTWPDNATLATFLRLRHSPQSKVEINRSPIIKVDSAKVFAGATLIGASWVLMLCRGVPPEAVSAVVSASCMANARAFVHIELWPSNCGRRVAVVSCQAI
jgi:hypothetical protein